MLTCIGYGGILFGTEEAKLLESTRPMPFLWRLKILSEQRNLRMSTLRSITDVIPVLVAITHHHSDEMLGYA